MSSLEFVKAVRLDQYVTDALAPDISRAFAAKLIERGDVIVNGNIAKAGQKVRPTDEVKILYVPAEQPPVPDINLPVVYEDDDCIVINKPSGILVHSKGGYNPEATVASWLRVKIIDQPLSNRAGIVHRLDRMTSGVMICAKTSNALSWLQKQFATRNVKKTYRAIITSGLQPAAAVIDMPIERNPKAPATFRVGPNGKPSVTEYNIISDNGTYSLIELKPTTGRTHQLRVHLKQLGHPIVGDELYGGEPADRLLLHAQKLEITLPNHERRTFEAAVPKDFEKYV